MTTKPPSSRLAASGPVDDPDSEQVTKEHNEDDDARDDVTVDPSEDVTVEATEDVTTEAVSQTPHPSIRPGNNSGATPGARAPTLLGVPIQSLPLPGVTSASLQGETVRQIDYDDEITVLGQPAPADPLAALDALVDSFDRPSITDDDEEETKVEPAETAMKAAESTGDVTTALSAQASLEREKALRRASAPAASPGQFVDDLEFADPEADEEVEEEDEEESLDDELSDEDEVISAGGAIEEERDADDDVHDGVATATFMKPADSTGLSGLLNPRRPPTGNPYGRDGFGSRLPTPSPGYSPASSAPAPSTSPFASRLGPAPKGSPYSGRGTGTSIPAIQIPAPSGATATPSEPGFFTRRLQVPGYGLLALVGGALVLGYGIGALGSGKSAPAPAAVVAKPATAPAAPAAPVVEPVVAGGTAATGTEAKPATSLGEAPAKPTPAVADLPGSGPPDQPAAEVAAEGGLSKPGKKPAAPKPKPAIEPIADDTAAKPAPKPAVATTPKPAVAAAPKPAVATTPKPATAAAKPAKKPTKVWVDPFAN
jgi:hypothetical protein